MPLCYRLVVAAVCHLGLAYPLTAQAGFRSPQSRAADALALAIEHFDRDHSRGLTADSLPYYFMVGLLRAVDRQFPPLAELHRGVTGFTFSGLEHGFYSFEDDTSAASLKRQGPARDWVARLGAGCFRETDLRQATRPRDSMPVERWSRTVYHLEDAGCHDSVAGRLARAGLDRLEWTDSELYGRLGQSHVAVSGGSMRDMVFLWRQLLADPVLAPFIQWLEAQEGYSTGGQAPWDIVLVGSSGRSGFTDLVRLRFIMRWGGCPAGCTAQHEWLVEAQPSLRPPTTPKDERFQFRLRLVEERGTPLPPPRQLWHPYGQGG